MAVSAKISLLLFLLTLLSSHHHIHARESQFFNKIPSDNNLPNGNEPNREDPSNKPGQEPDFIPENEKGGYGLYGHESGQLPPSDTKPTTTTTNLPYNNQPNEFLPKYLPKNYNTESYVTEPEGYHPAQEANNNNYYNTAGNAYNQDQKQVSTASNGGNYYQNYGGNSYNGQQQGVNEDSFAQNSEYYKGVEKQGMSDTRFLENGRYFHDINLDKNKGNSFENTEGFGQQYSQNGGYYRNNENSHEFNKYSNGGFENQGEQFQDFQDDEALP